jgi:DNA-binding transcriptional LysR family regulator
MGAGDLTGKVGPELDRILGELRVRRSAGIDMVPAVPMEFKEHLPVAEHERDETADRDRVRKIVEGAVDIFLSLTLHTPGDRALDVERLFAEVKTTAVPAVREYRARQRQRFAVAAAATDRLGDPTDLTCEDP